MEDDESLPPRKPSITSTTSLLPRLSKIYKRSSSYSFDVTTTSQQRSSIPRSAMPSKLSRSLSSSTILVNFQTKDADLSLPNGESSESESKSEKERKGFRRYSRYQKLVLLCVSMVCFTSYLLMAILAPFFPAEASRKGMTQTISGLTFSIYALVIMLSSPIFGKILPIVKAKPMLLVGVAVSGLANIGFGLLDKVDEGSWFIASSLVMRSLEGLGAAAFSTASYTYIMHTFPDDVSAAMGLTETFIGIGETIGPAIGGGLYAVGGYGLPFFVLGSFVLLTIPLCAFVLKPISDEEEPPASKDTIVPSPSSDCVVAESSVQTPITPLSRGNDESPPSTVISSPQLPPSSSSSTSLSTSLSIDSSSYQSSQPAVVNGTYWKLIRIPEIIVVSLVVIVISQSQAFLEPTIEPHFSTFGLDASFVAFTFLLMAVAYAISSPLSGWIASRVNKTLLMVFGLLLSSVGLLLLGPSSVLSIILPGVQLKGNLATGVTSMIIMGSSYAIAFIPTFESLLDIALENGFPDNVTTYSLISGLWGASFSLGEVTGPVLGGFLVDQFNFKVASTVMSVLSVVTAITCVLMTAVRRCKRETQLLERCVNATPPFNIMKEKTPTNSYGSIKQADHYVQ